MRKTGIFILALTMLAGAAIAYGPGFGGGRGMSGGGFGGGVDNTDGGFGGGQGYCGNCPGYNTQAEAVTEEEAKAAVEAYIADYFKGFSIKSFESYEVPRGTMYQATVSDTNGNTFLFHVNPWGRVAGPFVPSVQ